MPKVTDRRQLTPALARRVLDPIVEALPRGRSLPEDVWRARHRGILALLWLHVAIILVFALMQGETLVHSLDEAGIVAVIAIAASLALRGRVIPATIASFGLITSSAILTHLSGGYIEFHFHFFIMLALIAIYQEWFPFLLSILYVAGQHGLVGVIDPESVYNHPDAIANPWKWAAIHAMFVSFACGAYLLTWRWNEAARDHAKLVLNSAGEGIVGVSNAGTVLFVNPAAERITGYRTEELIGRSLDGILEPEGQAAESAGSKTALGLPEAQATEGTIRSKDGTTFPAEFIRSSIRDRSKITGSVVTFRDTSERMQAQETIRYLAYHDHVTGLANRALFQDRFTMALAHARRYQQVLVIMSLDLDDFKINNDSYGHAAGDAALHETAKRLEAATRESDTVARVGGDEFSLLLPGTAVPGDAEKIAQKLLRSVRRPLKVDGREFQLGASIGMSLYPDDGDDPETLLRKADAAMYQAKKQGRNAYRFYGDPDTPAGPSSTPRLPRLKRSAPSVEPTA